MVRKDIKDFVSKIPQNVTLVAATKYVNSDDMKTLFDAGIQNFGENRVDSFIEKHEKLANLDIKWHFIGHLQRNKAKNIANLIDYIHSLDSIELAKILNKERNTPLNCFIEVSINNEENKNGVKIENIFEFVENIKPLKNIKIIGLMMMTIKNSSSESNYNQFKKLSDLKDEVEKKCKIKIPFLSMGMSSDYQEAIKAGATHIRLGRILFN